MWKHQTFYPKDVCSVFVVFMTQQVCPRKYRENEIFNYTSHKTKQKLKEEEQDYNPTLWLSFLKLLKNYR